MLGITRGFATLVGAAVAGFLIWVAAQVGSGSTSDYWFAYGLVAASGLTMALSQVLGGWTKWGWPRLSRGVFGLGFLPVLIVGGWVLLARMPAETLNTGSFSRDIGIGDVVNELGGFLAAIAFGIGLTFGLTFDTAPRRREVERGAVEDPDALSEPLTAELEQPEPDQDEPALRERATADDG